MVAVLVTRPRAASEKFALELKRHGFDAYIEPLLLIEPLATSRPVLHNVQAVMITSANAIHALASGDYDIGDYLGLPCFCVGPQTGQAAKDFGFRDVRSASTGGSGLAQMIAGALPDQSKPLLHIAAQDVDSRAQSGLEQAGYKVTVWPVYAARPATELTKETIRRFERREFDAIVVFSTRTAQVLKELLSQHALQACCESLSAIGLSEAVVEALRPLPWRKLVAAPMPTEDAVIECLKQLHPVS